MAPFLRPDSNSIGDRMRHFGSTGKKKKRRVKRSYQQFFDGYVEIPTEKENGKGVKVERLYVADYHVSLLTTWKKIGIRVLHLLVFGVSLAIFATAAVTSNSFNRSWYAVIPQAIALAALVYGIITLLVRYIPSMGKMTNWEFGQAVTRLRQIQKFTPWFLIVSAAAALFSLIFHPDEAASVLTCVLRFLLSAALIWLDGLVESRAPYGTVPSGNAAPIGAIDIATMKEIRPPKPKKDSPAGGYALEDLSFEEDDEDENEIPRYF